MKKNLFIFLALILGFQVNDLKAQDEETNWKVGGALGVDFSQLLLINPKIGAGEDRIGLGGNATFFANYKKDRILWNNSASLAFAIQRLGTFKKEIPFQKTVDELRVNSNFNYGITEESPFGYALDVLFLSQITPTYTGNTLSNKTGAYPLAKFLSPATITISPGISYNKKTGFGELYALLSPASLKMIVVADDTIAMTGLHGNPRTLGGTAEDFQKEWGKAHSGIIGSSTAPLGYFDNNYLQFGANLKAGWKHKFFAYKEGKKDKHRLLVATSINLYSNYLRGPQNLDVEWITNVDLFLFKGLSISLMTNLFYDHDVMVQVDRDNDVNTGVNGYESTGRRISFLQQLLVKYNFLF